MMMTVRPSMARSRACVGGGGVAGGWVTMGGWVGARTGVCGFVCCGGGVGWGGGGWGGVGWGGRVGEKVQAAIGASEGYAEAVWPSD